MSTRISDEELLDDLRRVDEEVDGPVTLEVYDELGKYSRETIRQRFGGWIAGLEKAGVESATSPTHLSDEELIEDLRRVESQVDGPLTTAEYDRLGKVAVSTIEERFGSWTKGLEAADLEALGPGVRKEAHPPKEDLITDLQRVDAEVVGPLTIDEYNARGEFHANTIKRAFGSWNQGKEAADIEILPAGEPKRDRTGALRSEVLDAGEPRRGRPGAPRQFTDKELLDDLRRVDEEVEGSLTRQEYDKRGQVSSTTIINRFGGWNAAKAIAGAVAPRNLELRPSFRGTRYIRVVSALSGGASGQVTLPLDAFEGTAFEGVDSIDFTDIADGSVAVSPGGDFALTERADTFAFTLPAPRVVHLDVVPGEDFVEIIVQPNGMRIRRLPEVAQFIVRRGRVDE